MTEATGSAQVVYASNSEDAGITFFIMPSKPLSLEIGQQVWALVLNPEDLIVPQDPRELQETSRLLRVVLPSLTTAQAAAHGLIIKWYKKN